MSKYVSAPDAKFLEALQKAHAISIKRSQPFREGRRCSSLRGFRRFVSRTKCKQVWHYTLSEVSL